MQRDSKQFWNTISKLNKRKNNVCAMIDGRVGNDACNAFFDKYKNLYNKNPSPDIEQTRQSIQREISTKCCECVGNEKHMHEVSLGMVRDGIKKLKSGQYDEHSMLMSDSLIYGSDKLFVMLAILFTMMIKPIWENIFMARLELKRYKCYKC